MKSRDNVYLSTTLYHIWYKKEVVLFNSESESK